MKEIIKKKMDEHIDRILAKEEISNEDYYLLSMLYNRIEMDEKNAEMAAQMEIDKAKNKEKQKEIYESLMKGFAALD